MIMNTFFVCPECGNAERFKVFTSNFQIVKQSAEGVRIYESSAMPNLRENDNYIECQLCSKRSEYNQAVDIGNNYLGGRRTA
ncbi:MAG: hypothetical protein Q6358_08390 [Candidatus Brocadiales bacterium]|nr:hypothetical protein [Candidatus Brocadiales bacterium]